MTGQPLYGPGAARADAAVPSTPAGQDPLSSGEPQPLPSSPGAEPRTPSRAPPVGELPGWESGVGGPGGGCGRPLWGGPGGVLPPPPRLSRADAIPSGPPGPGLELAADLRHPQLAGGGHPEERRARHSRAAETRPGLGPEGAAGGPALGWGEFRAGQGAEGCAMRAVPRTGSLRLFLCSRLQKIQWRASSLWAKNS